MERLAHEAGYSLRMMNMQYGNFARRLAIRIPNVDLPECRTFFCCEFVQPMEQTNQQYLLVMRPNFAEALKLAKTLH